jgi:hypothetical protein
MFSIQKNHGPVECTDVSCIGRCNIVCTTSSYTVMHNTCLCLWTYNSIACINWCIQMIVKWSVFKHRTVWYGINKYTYGTILIRWTKIMTISLVMEFLGIKYVIGKREVYWILWNKCAWMQNGKYEENSKGEFTFDNL